MPGPKSQWSSSLPTHLAEQLDIAIDIEDEAISSVKVTAADEHNPAYMRRATVFAALDPYIDKARAGAPNDWLAEVAGVSVAAAREWKLTRGIRGTRSMEELFLAVDMFGDEKSTHRALHRSIRSSVEGKFEVPEYMARHPLIYDEMARQVHFLMTELGTTVKQVSEGLGLREKDVAVATKVYASHLKRSGVKCSVCRRMYDPKYGDVCSTRCAVRARGRRDEGATDRNGKVRGSPVRG